VLISLLEQAVEAGELDRKSVNLAEEQILKCTGHNGKWLL
jgi:hypothetical protein